jgi:hypothetical protein
MTHAPPSPRLCCRASLAFCTYLLSALPFNYQHNSAHYANPVAPNGCPLDIKPPLGFTTTFPPYVKSPLSIASPAFPSLQSPIDS